MPSFKDLKYIIEKDRVYNTPKKQEVRDILIDKYILPKLKKGKQVSVLDLFGTGLFVERLLQKLEDHASTVKNLSPSVYLYEIEQDKKLWWHMKGFIKDHFYDVKNHVSLVSINPFYGSLSNFVQRHRVKNHILIDLIWIDHCGIATMENTALIKPLVGNDTVICITSSIVSGATNMRTKSLHQLDADIEQTVNKSFPLMKTTRIRSYRTMAVYIAKVPNYIKKNLPTEVCEEPVLQCKEVPTI